MRKYISKKWKHLSKEQQEEALQNITDYVGADGNSAKTGECIVDFKDHVSISGKLVESEDCSDLVIDDNAIFYDPREGVIIENEKFKDLISLKDAAIMFGKEESTLRRNIQNGFFQEWTDCIKIGKQWVFDIKALEEKYK